MCVLAQPLALLVVPFAWVSDEWRPVEHVICWREYLNEMCDNELVVGSAMCRDEGNGPINAAEMSLDVGIYGGKQRANLTLVENNFWAAARWPVKWQRFGIS